MSIKIRTLNDIRAVANYLSRIGAEARSIRTAVVKQVQGAYWTDLATIRIGKDGKVDAPDSYMPTEAEAALIKAECAEVTWPEAITIAKNYKLPKELERVESERIFEYKNLNGEIVMLRERVENAEGGEKSYIPYTFWNDGEWRKAEPEGALPIYGLDTIGDHTTAFVHEGEKAARFVHRLIHPNTDEEKARLAAHPWGLELSAAAHLGWQGGALTPHRTDWDVLRKTGLKRIIIVADNDTPGKSAVPKIAQRLKGMTVFSIEFSDQFPGSFDLADPFPERMFSEIAGKRHYTGPAFRSMQNPATWATDLLPNPEGKGRPITVLREEFRSMWVWVEESDVYVCKEMPEIIRNAAIFDGMVAPFSHIGTTSTLLKKKYQGRECRLAYRPDIKARMISDGQSSAVNLHTPTNIRSTTGDPAPWEEFLAYLFPIEEERHEVAKWCATLIARPEIRMLYGLLLISTRQGMGKSTLGERILAPLVGMQNTGFPSERDIVESNFNSWIANKRLVVIGEIYTGQSWKAYNTLKSYVTDKSINVNEKFQRPYVVENWAHIVACSNSQKALRVEETDRRWYYPRIGEIAWDAAKWSEFHDWIAAGGLSIIKRWAENFGDYVRTGQHAPMTVSKQTLIHESKSEAIVLFEGWIEAVASERKEVAIGIQFLKRWLEKGAGKLFESGLDLKRCAINRGWEICPERITLGSVTQDIFLSPDLVCKLKAGGPRSAAELRDEVRKFVRDPADVAENAM